MNWFQQNRFLGTFLLAFAVTTIAALLFLLHARSDWNEATTHLESDVAEMGRLQRLTPFPSGENLRKMKAHAEDYGAAVERLKSEWTTRVLSAVPLAPSEFQSRLRVAMGAITEKARANKVKLPDNFFLGFDEFASALPDTAAAPVLAQELSQVELLLNILADAHVTAITGFRRSPPAAATNSATTAAKKNATTTPNLIDRGVVELSFVSSPAAARRVLNQVVSIEKQFYIVRLLHVRNEKEKGPAREATPAPDAAVAQPAAKPGLSPALSFIVGNEKIETSARIEMVRLAF